MLDETTKTKIESFIKEHRVALFMKGTRQFPQCGFSGRAVEILKACGCKDFGDFNVLADIDVREGIKEYSDWPTIPQLYVDGVFRGGSDVMMDMYESGELQRLLQGPDRA